MSKSFLYCGGGDAIHLLALDGSKVTVAHASRSFFLAAHPRLPVLYSVDEEAHTVAAFSIGPDGALREINRLPSAGEVPCHLAADASGRYLVVASYMGGVELYPLRADGGLEPHSDLHQPVGSGPHENQKKPHPHGVALAGNLAYVSDLGTDRIYVFKIEGTPPRFTLLPELTQSAAPGAGPRHIVLHLNGKHALCVNELDNTVTSFRRDANSGALTPLNTAPTLPTDFKGVSWTAEIGYHPAASVCYATNRGHETLAAFIIDSKVGTLKFAQFIEAGGRQPQNFLVSHDGSLLLIANMGSGNVVGYRLDPATGLPQRRSSDLAIKSPMCLLEVSTKG